MRNRRFLSFEKPVRAPRPAPTGQTLAKADLSLPGHQSLMALYDRLAKPGQTERATTHRPTVFDGLYHKLGSLHQEKSAQPLRRRMAINWVETDGLLLEVHVKHLRHA